MFQCHVCAIQMSLCYCCDLKASGVVKPSIIQSETQLVSIVDPVSFVVVVGFFTDHGADQFMYRPSIVPL